MIEDLIAAAMACVIVGCCLFLLYRGGRKIWRYFFNPVSKKLREKKGSYRIWCRSRAHQKEEGPMLPPFNLQPPRNYHQQSAE